MTAATAHLYADLLTIIERCRAEVTITRSNGVTAIYAPIRLEQEVEKANAEGLLVPMIARLMRKPTWGFSHLVDQGRADLTIETLVLDEGKPYHHLFSANTRALAEGRLATYRGACAA